MDAYEQAWRKVARSRSLDDIIRDIERSRDHYYGSQQYLVRQSERKAERQAMERYYSSMEPIEGWVGPCWLRPDGKAYPVQYTNHWARAVEILRNLGVRLDAWQSEDDWLCKRGWVRIGEEGKVTDAQWQRTGKWTDEQAATINEMLMKAQTGQHFNKYLDYYFVEGLERSIRFASEQQGVFA